MKISLEGRDYEFKANGALMKKYQETFNETLLMAMYNMTTQRDMLSCAKIIYCGIGVEESFNDWLESFESPVFVLGAMDKVMEYLTRSTAPTVESKEDKTEVKKKTK